MIGVGVLYPRVNFEFVVSGINRGDNAGLHVIYSGTVAGAREGAMRGNAVGIAASLCSYSRTADYSEVGGVVLFDPFIIA
jgi:5'-nucleotidase